MTEMQSELRMAARALARHGLAHAYGHVSRRLDADTFLVCAARPMALIGPADAGTVVPVKGALPEGVLGEVRIHQQIYARRPDVQAVARTMPPALMALGTARRTRARATVSGPTSAAARPCGTTRSCCATMPPRAPSPKPW